MDWLLTALQWYLFLLILGLIFYPLVGRFFSSFFDRGYPFSKTVAVLALTYLTFVVGSLRILPFTQISLFALIILVLATMIFYIKKGKLKFDLPLKVVLIEEILFLLAFLFLVFVRGQEPSVRGLEKFMDFGFMNSALRSRYFPPLDMWLSADPTHPAGYPINYYYFGHLTGAFLIKLAQVKPSVGYNLILATIFGQGITLAFSLSANLVYLFQVLVLKVKKVTMRTVYLIGALGSYLVNLAGNLHTIYLFTKGYPNDNPIPFWQIMSWFNPEKYWYPNATRFIPYTIHEFPSYSYVVADLHGHVFDIPFVLLTLALLLVFYIQLTTAKIKQKIYIWPILALGFMTAVHYMTNAFDGPIYLLLSFVVFFLAFGLTSNFWVFSGLTFLSFIIFSLPFTIHFNAFVSGVGVNCSSHFLTNLGRFGPFIFEQGKCQVSPLWMLFVLWGFFFINFVLFASLKWIETKKNSKSNLVSNPFDFFVLALFTFGFFLLAMPEFFYVKDIYPLHFRANTMFKLGYQAFMMMAIASSFVFYRFSLMKSKLRLVFKAIFMVIFFLVFLYPFFSFPSYYGSLNKTPQLDGSRWLYQEFPQDAQLINYLNTQVAGQPIILEAQGDSYTDYERISAYTGLPTVAGWWVHEWLWRGSADVVGKRIPEIEQIYQSQNLDLTRSLLDKYQIQYVLVSGFEKEKYKTLNEQKFSLLGRLLFKTSNGVGALYQVK